MTFTSSAVDVVDSTWCATRPATLAGLVAQPANWRRWWPGLTLRVDEWRGEKGVRWYVDEVTDGPVTGLVGTAEVWLQDADDGVIAHFFLRLDRPGARSTGDVLDARSARRVEHHFRMLTKQAFWALADQLDPGRMTRHASVSAVSSASAASQTGTTSPQTGATTPQGPVRRA